MRSRVPVAALGDSSDRDIFDAQFLEHFGGHSQLSGTAIDKH
jgi:hypothetical protein